MASLTQWTWVWVNSGSWQWTGRTGVLQSMESQRVRQDRVTELNWKKIINLEGKVLIAIREALGAQDQMTLSVTSSLPLFPAPTQHCTPTTTFKVLWSDSGGWLPSVAVSLWALTSLWVSSSKQTPNTKYKCSVKSPPPAKKAKTQTAAQKTLRI